MNLDPLALWTITLSALCATSCALLGCFLMLKRMSLLGDGLSHGVLPGIVLSVLLTGQFTGPAILVGAMVFGMLTALLTEALSSLGQLSEDTSLGVVFTTLFALGVALISAQHGNADLDLACVFMGRLEDLASPPWGKFGVPDALPTLALMLVLTLAFISACWKELLVATFDADLAHAMGLKPRLVTYLLIALVAASTVTAFEVVGSVLVLAMLITPGATAFLLTQRLGVMLAVAAGLAITASVGGYFAATLGPYSVNIAGSTAVVAGVQLVLAITLAPRAGLVAQAWRRTRLSLRIAADEILAGLYRAEEAQKPYYAAPTEHALPSWLIGLAYRILLRKGLVQQTAGLAALTSKGRAVAAYLVRSHRLLETYAGQVFDLPADHVHEPASRLEHFLGPKLQRELADELAQPPTDPHGKAIPSPAGEEVP